MLFFNANFICYYFYPTKKREEPINSLAAAPRFQDVAGGRDSPLPKDRMLSILSFGRGIFMQDTLKKPLFYLQIIIFL